MPTSSELFAARLAAFRSRAWLVLFVRDLCVTLMIASAVVIGVQLLAGVARPAGWRWVRVGVAIACISAAIISYLRRPSLRATASAIDRGLALEDRIVAGLQVANDEDVVSRLVVREAIKVLQRALPHQVFPLRPRYYAVVAGLLFASAAILSLTTAGSLSARFRPSAQRAAGPAGGGPIASTERPERDSNAPVSAAVTGERRSQDPSNARSPAASAQSAARPADSNPTTSSRENTQAETSGISRSQSSSMSTPTAGSQPSTGRDSQAVVASGTRNETTAGGTVVGAGASRPSQLQGAGAQGASSDARRSGNRAGGIDGGAVTIAVAEGRRPTGSSASSRSFANAARAEAEAALTRDDIPPEFRRYLRDYFRALQGAPASPGTGRQR